MFLFRKYNHLLDTRPIITKCCTSFVTFGMGDLISQKIEGKEFNPKRFFIQASFGFMIASYFHIQFCKIMPFLFPSTSKHAVVKNILYDQLFGAPIFTSCFFLYLDVMGGKSFNQAGDELKVKLFPTILDNWKVWPFLMAINFSVVPLAYRVLFANICGMFWSAYLSWVSNVKSKRMLKKD